MLGKSTETELSLGDKELELLKKIADEEKVIKDEIEEAIGGDSPIEGLRVKILEAIKFRQDLLKKAYNTSADGEFDEISDEEYERFLRMTGYSRNSNIQKTRRNAVKLVFEKQEIRGGKPAWKNKGNTESMHAHTVVNKKKPNIFVAK